MFSLFGFRLDSDDDDDDSEKKKETNTLKVFS